MRRIAGSFVLRDWREIVKDKMAERTYEKGKELRYKHGTKE
jgi:hypothetical protein